MIVFGTLSCPFLLKESDKAEVSTIRGGTRAGCVRPWLTRNIVWTVLFRRGWARFWGDWRSGTINSALFMMGSAVKWVFCALFDTMSIVKLFHPFEYRKIHPNDSSWRCALYHITICNSWLQLVSSSIFQLPNKSSSFRLHHSANEKLLN